MKLVSLSLSLSLSLLFLCVSLSLYSFIFSIIYIYNYNYLLFTHYFIPRHYFIGAVEEAHVRFVDLTGIGALQILMAPSVGR